MLSNFAGVFIVVVAQTLSIPVCACLLLNAMFWIATAETASI